MTALSEFDLVGVGYGPANIGLSIALDEAGWPGRCVFLERGAVPSWQDEMLLDGSDVQHNPLRDFITPVNPRSRYTFTNYLYETGRLFEYLNSGLHYALRKDYAAYIRWVASKFDAQVRYGEEVVDIDLVPVDGDIRLCVETRGGGRVLARALSFAPGRTPFVPQAFQHHLSDRVIHFTRYASAAKRWRSDTKIRTIAVVGSSQSAVEIVLDLASRIPDAEIISIHREFGFQLKDTSPFTEKIYLSEFTDLFYACSEPRQREIRSKLWRSNYSAADADVIQRLHATIYEQDIDGSRRIHLMLSKEINKVIQVNNRLNIEMIDKNTLAQESIEVDAVVLATGFRDLGTGDNQERWPRLLSKIAPSVRKREDGSLFISRDYRLEFEGDGQSYPTVFINGLCEATHGFGDAGSFSLLALRSALISSTLQERREDASRRHHMRGLDYGTRYGTA